jgi:hypothetical protein
MFYYFVGNTRYQGVAFSFNRIYQPKGEQVPVYYMKCVEPNCSGRGQIRDGHLTVDDKHPHSCMARTVADRLADLDAVRARNEMKHLARTTSTSLKARFDFSELADLPR